MQVFVDIFLAAALIPAIYYLIAIFSAWRFFSTPDPTPDVSFTPPVSNLKPIRGLDPGAYENFASFCRQDYPDYELLFCVGSMDDPAVPILEQLRRDFPERQIRIVVEDGNGGVNDKVMKLDRLVREAKHDVLVINDSDVRARGDYLRNVVAPLADAKVGAVTCFYLPIEEKGLTQALQNISMLSDFFASTLVARQLDGVKFALGTTIATRRSCLEQFGGYRTIKDRPGDDLLIGRLIAEQGYEVRLSHYPISTVPDYQSLRELLHKRMRWQVVMRHMRPWGHLGLLLTQGLPWAVAAIALHPTPATAAVYLGIYSGLRCAMTWIIGVHGLKHPGVWRRMPLIVLWDGLAFAIWLASFGSNSIRWRNQQYRIRNGMLVPVTSKS
ncbi:MAG TPA: glycosyltransferase [Candidatus Binatia bacterium]|nr:glycosyltransferase [Candidatus Binatia bacterium]